MEKRFGKKGVSPVIATVLLLALVFILALFVFMYFKGFISEQVEKFGQPVDNICRSVSFDVRDRQDGDTTTYFLEIVNRGNAPIYYFNMEKVSGGDSDIETLEVSLTAGEGTSISTEFESSIKEVIFYPVLLGNIKGKDISKPFICEAQGKTIIL